jgi:hypothetical protein
MKTILLETKTFDIFFTLLAPTLAVIVEGFNKTLNENYEISSINEYLFFGFLFSYLFILLNPKTSLKR